MVGTRKEFNEAVADIISRATPIFIEDNRKLNIGDCYKDGRTISSKNKLFDDSIESLFGAQVAPMKVFDDVKKRIMKDKKYGADPRKICWIQILKPAELHHQTTVRGREKYFDIPEGRRDKEWVPTSASAKLPAFLKHGIHDSGYNPKEVQPKIELILTPGSYIDPFSRNKKTDGSKVWSHFDPVPKGVFKALGFEKAISTFHGLENGNNMDVTMKLRNGTEVKIKRDVKHNHMGPGIDFFIGNAEKNKWFNSPKMVPGISIDDLAKMYVLGKELGDTMQVIDAKLIMGVRNPAICLFTDDNTVTVRCHELGVPVCVKEHSGKDYADLGRCNYYPGVLDKKDLDILKDSYIEQFEENNKKVIWQIENILTIGLFYLGNNEIKLNDKLREFFGKIRESILNVPKRDILKELKKRLPIDRFENICRYFSALLIAEGCVIRNHDTRRIFLCNDMKYENDMYSDIRRIVPELHDPIFEDLAANTFGELLITYSGDPKTIAAHSKRTGRGITFTDKMAQLKDAIQAAEKAGSDARKNNKRRRNNGSNGRNGNNGSSRKTKRKRGGSRLLKLAEQQLMRISESATGHFYDSIYDIVKFIFEQNQPYYLERNYFKSADECIAHISYDILSLSYLVFNFIGDTPTAFEVLFPYVYMIMNFDMDLIYEDFQEFYRSIPYVKGYLVKARNTRKNMSYDLSENSELSVGTAAAPVPATAPAPAPATAAATGDNMHNSQRTKTASRNEEIKSS